MKPPFSLETLSTKPGCYLFKDILGEIIYIGKAKNLKKRVSSYFSKHHDDIKTKQLVEHIRDVEIIVTTTEIDAFLLESNLIKRHKPKYNIDLKYGVRYAWIVLTKETYPRLLTARAQNYDGEYFGPFVSGQLRQVLLDILRKKFFIRTCRTLPKKACLRYHIGLCHAPCIHKNIRDEYSKNVEHVRLYLQGKNKDLIKTLQFEMRSFSDNLNFEAAKLRKDQIDSLKYLQEQILVENTRVQEEDVINYVLLPGSPSSGPIVHVLVFSFRRGVLVDKQTFKIPYEESILDSFVKSYYATTPPPQTIILPQELSDSSIYTYLKTLADRAIKIVVPRRGLKKELLDLVKENLHASTGEAERLAMEFQQNLKTDVPIRTIECFDISHLSGTNMVASMVQFVDGKPKKNNYRKFKIQSLDGVDDFRAMYEVVNRRYKRLFEEKKKFPDLIVVDGGALQLEFALKALQELGLDIPIIGLAKKFEEVYFPYKKLPSRFDQKSFMMRTLIQARDEAHRFAITFQRSLRSKELK